MLSLGSNIEPVVNLPLASRLLADRLQVLGFSAVFETTPADFSQGPVFLNAAAEVTCELTPRALKYEVLRPLERELGRTRTADRNAPRTIDLDISLVGQRIIEDSEADLRIPDPEILTRSHVAVPLANLAPERIHPVTGQRLREIANQLGARGVRPRPDLRLFADPESADR